MSGYFIHIEKRVNKKQLVFYFSNVLDMPEKEFFIVDGFIGNYFDDSNVLTLDYDYGNDSRILCERYDKEGDFKTYIEMGFKDEIGWPTELEFAKKLSKELDCKCLIGSEELNPWHWIMITPDGMDREIYVDVDRLDNHNEFVFDRYVGEPPKS